MSIESEQLIYDYLSRVGDLAQQALPAAERMRLVNQVRDEVERRRAETKRETPAAVRRMLGRLGSPEAVVERAAGVRLRRAGEPGPLSGRIMSDPDEPAAPGFPPYDQAPPPSGPPPAPEDPSSEDPSPDAATRTPPSGPSPRPGMAGVGSLFDLSALSNIPGLSGLADLFGGSTSKPAADTAPDGSEGDPDANADSGAGGASGRGAGTGPGAGAGHGTGTGAGPGANADPGAGAGPGAAPGSGTSEGRGPGAKRFPRQNTGPGFQPNAGPWPNAAPDDPTHPLGDPHGPGPVWDLRDVGEPNLGMDPDWWRAGAPPGAPFDTGTEAEPGTEDDDPGGPGTGMPTGQRDPVMVRKHWWSRPVPVVPVTDVAAPAPRRRGLNVVFFWREMTAALLLVVGTATGFWIAAIAGWLLAYYSARLSRMEAQCAAIGFPVLAAGATWLWVWGRANGRWGAPLHDGHYGPALRDAVPVVVRIAALCSAAFLVWRAQRRSRAD